MYSIARVQHDLEELRLRCAQLESSLATSDAELQRLREINQRVQQRRTLDTVSEVHVVCAVLHVWATEVRTPYYLSFLVQNKSPLSLHFPKRSGNHLVTQEADQPEFLLLWMICQF